MSAFGGRAGGTACPCGSEKAYDACCGRLHRREAAAETAVQLMRSRYVAYVRRDADYLFATWHPSTRPASVDLDSGLSWRRLEVLDVRRGAVGDADGEVEFRAHYEHGGTPGNLHERSRFTRRGGRWLYLDGEVT